MNLIQRCISIFLALFMVLGSVASAQMPAAQAQSTASVLPDSPGFTASTTTAQLESSQQVTTPPQQQKQTTPAQTTPQSQSPVDQKPLGTAVAEVPPPSGVAVSNSAGAAVAPAKQRRVRTIVIGVGVLLAAGVAIGSVAALSSASPSRPPGSH